MSKLGEGATPGPWYEAIGNTYFTKLGQFIATYPIYDETWEMLSVVIVNDKPDQAEANARLIAKAPLLVEAQGLVNDFTELLTWLSASGNLKSPIEPHPYGLAVIEVKQRARALLAKLEAE